MPVRFLDFAVGMTPYVPNGPPEPELPEISVTVTGSAAEGGTHTITVTATATSASAMSFNLAVQGSAGPDSVNAADFGGSFPTWTGVTIAPGDLTATRTFAAVDDADIEPNETGVVALSGASGCVIAVATAEFTVLNNDVAGPTLVDLVVSPSSATVGVAYTGATTGLESGNALSLTGAGAAGLSINSTTGAITGTPTTAGPVNIVSILAGATNTPHTTYDVMAVAAAGGFANTRLPLISGAAYVGQVMAAGEGAWSARHSITSKNWQRADSVGGPYTDISGATADFHLVTGTDSGKYLRHRVTATDGIGTATAYSLPSAAVQTMTMAIPAVVSNPVLACCGASFEADLIRGSTADRVGWWTYSAIMGKFMNGNKRIRHIFSGAMNSPTQPYLKSQAGAAASVVRNQAAALAIDSAYLAESAHVIFINGGGNTLDISNTGGTSWLNSMTAALSDLRTAYPNAQIMIPEQVMRSTTPPEWSTEAGFARANVYQVNAALPALCSTYGVILVPWFARSGDPANALEGRSYEWANQTDFVHPAAGRSWDMSRSFGASIAPYLADLGNDTSGTTVLTSVGAGSGGTLAGGATGAVWANWTLTGQAGKTVAGSISGDRLRIVATATADDATSTPIFALARTAGQFLAAAGGTSYVLRAKLRLRSATNINVYTRIELTDATATLAGTIMTAALLPGNRNGGFTISTTTSGAQRIGPDWVELSLESPPINRGSAINLTPRVVVEARDVAGGLLTGQQIEVEVDDLRVVSL